MAREVWFRCFTLLLLVLVSSSQRLVLRPKPKHCENRVLHDRQFFGGKDHYYFFSWLHPTSRNLEVDWLDARNICRLHCMDAVSIETPEENEYINKKLIEYGVPYIWTSGRKCNFKGCQRPDLLPLEINGWFWAGSGEKIGSTNIRSAGNWSPTGGIGLPQPDNRGFLYGDEDEEEACMAVMNNFYNDGIKWHDVGCYHDKPFICEDNDELINYIESSGGDVKGVTFDRDIFTAPIQINGPVRLESFENSSGAVPIGGSQSQSNPVSRLPPLTFFVR